MNLRLAAAGLFALPLLLFTVACSGGADSGSKDADLNSFRADMALDISGSDQLKGTIEVVLPDRLHAVFPASEGNRSTETISIGQDNYHKSGSASWSKQQQAPEYATVTLALLQAKAWQTSGANKGPEETVEGKKCQAYAVPFPDVATSPGPRTAEICLADGRPLRISFAVGNRKSSIVITRYNPKVEINAPN